MIEENERFLDELEAQEGKAARKAAEKFITFDGKHPCETRKKAAKKRHPAGMNDGHIADPWIRRQFRS